MARTSNPKARSELFVDKPAQTLVRAWAKRMAQGSAVVIPVYVGGTWTLQVPRGNKRVLQLQIKSLKG